MAKTWVENFLVSISNQQIYCLMTPNDYHGAPFSLPNLVEGNGEQGRRKVWKSGGLVKVAFFQKVQFVFQISKSPKQITPNHYLELEIWISCLLLWAGISNFKFRIVIWSNLLRISISEKKATFMRCYV